MFRGSSNVDDIDISGYYTARQYCIDGVTEAAAYKKLINNRAVYMLGTIHKGTLKRERSWVDALNDADEYVEDLDFENLLDTEEEDGDIIDDEEDLFDIMDDEITEESSSDAGSEDEDNDGYEDLDELSDALGL
jgi:hypothetical protein